MPGAHPDPASQKSRIPKLWQAIPPLPGRAVSKHNGRDARPLAGGWPRHSWRWAFGRLREDGEKRWLKNAERSHQVVENKARAFGTNPNEANSKPNPIGHMRGRITMHQFGKK